MILLVIAISCFSLLFAVYLARYVVQRDTGTEKMQEISNAIKEGAEAFLSRQNRTIVSLAGVLAALIFVLYAFVRTPNPADPVPPVELAFWTTFSFVLGALCSVTAGYIGMWVSIRANIRTAAAVRSSLNEALRIALRGGAVSGPQVVVSIASSPLVSSARYSRTASGETDCGVCTPGASLRSFMVELCPTQPRSGTVLPTLSPREISDRARPPRPAIAAAGGSRETRGTAASDEPAAVRDRNRAASAASSSARGSCALRRRRRGTS